ncbi:YciI family protein [Micromonospora costi]|uniref:YciI family protein n=2 Tax=Micromonospora costi TaxID=1530042 RepID=A0A3A9ZVA9_9ACTN|nr:YciI family protein [Micromonospora costi]
MKVMVLIKFAGADEHRLTPTREVIAAMADYNERLVKAGIMLDGGGLRPSADGVQVVFEGGTTSVVDGPFTESKEVIGGYWLWQVGSVEEAVEWARQCPDSPDTGVRSVLEIRPYIEPGDFADEYTPEVRAQHARG